MSAELISIAPMMGWTDRHARYLLRLLSSHALLYTEMVTTGALLHGPRERLLTYNPEEHPLVIQLGGSDPKDLATCSRLAEDQGFDQINLNVGCPSDRVQSGQFGACLMAAPSLVADCVSSMSNKVSIPVTVKCRVGIDEMDGYESFLHFVEEIESVGCETFVIHARKAWLQGLSPRQNRQVPPLRYDYVYRLKEEKPHLNIVINGGIKSVAQVEEHLLHVDGVMLGREAYHNPFILTEIEQKLFEEDAQPKIISREEIVERWVVYMEREVANGEIMSKIARHVLGLYHGQPGARQWRRHLSDNMNSATSGQELFESAAHHLLKAA